MLSENYMGYEICNAGHTSGSLVVFKDGKQFSQMYFSTPTAARTAIDTYLRSLGKGDYPGYPLPVKFADQRKRQHIFKLP